MINNDSAPPPALKVRLRVVGQYIREKREALKLSQRALGQLFQPPVTTQFISNVERGATPLPPHHIPTLSRALQVKEDELLGVLEQEYAQKLSGKLGLPEHAKEDDSELFKMIAQAYHRADGRTQRAFIEACEKILRVAIKNTGDSTEGEGGASPPI